jgi:hypothetical protein
MLTQEANVSTRPLIVTIPRLIADDNPDSFALKKRRLPQRRLKVQRTPQRDDCQGIQTDVIEPLND